MTALLSAQNLTLRRGERALCSDMRLELGQGEICGLSGPSGSGKSSLLRAIAWLIPFESCDLRLRGRTVSEVGISEYRRKVLYVPQQVPPAAGSLSNWVHLVGGFRVNLDSKVAHLGERTRHFLGELQLSQTLCETPFEQLSLGERHRAYLALCLAADPEVFLLDEPTSALGPEHSLLVEQAMRGRAAIWVSHDHEQLKRVSSRIVEMQS